MASPGPYNGSTARTCAELSFLVYQKPIDIKQKAAAIVPNAVVEVHGTWVANSQICIVSGDKEIFVVFRGTVGSLRSIIANARMSRTWWGNGLVHRGFLGIALAAEPFVRRVLRQQNNRQKDLYFIGHSQGGAAAYLAAMTFALRVEPPRQSTTYTFGQPRAGNARFSRDAEKRLTNNLNRLANGRDIVVGVPFVWNGYDHTRDYFHYGQNWLVARRRQAAGQGWQFFRSSLSDHKMLQYLRRSHFNENKQI